jgi:hypothetical protein
VFNMSGIWELPGQYENSFARAVLGGWTLTSILSLNSGFPFTVNSGQDNARNGQAASERK